MIAKRERLEAAIAGQRGDRPPVALWRHFPVDDQDPRGLAEATLAFQQVHDFDFVKVTPASSYCLKDWGAQDDWQGSTEGTRRYGRRVIERPRDWQDLPQIAPTEGHLGAMLSALEVIVKGVGPDVPVIQTVFAPLAQAKNLAGSKLLHEHWESAPQALAEGLATITATTAAFVRAAAETGIAGIFYAVQHATEDWCDLATYRLRAERHDRAILESAGTFWLNVLHLHGSRLHFALAADYDVQVVNWHDRTAGPSLAAARRLAGGKALCGGLRRNETLVLGDPATVRAEASEAYQATSGNGWILGAGCVVPIIAPRANLLTVRRVVDGFA